MSVGTCCQKQGVRTMISGTWSPQHVIGNKVSGTCIQEHDVRNKISETWGHDHGFTSASLLGHNASPGIVGSHF